MKKIKVIVIDDHHLIHEGIRSFLSGSEDIELVGEGWAGEDLFRLVEQHEPDIVLLDLDMRQRRSLPAGTQGNRFMAIPAVTQLCQRYPNVGVIIITQHVSPALVDGLLNAGAKGYLLKDDILTSHLKESIRVVYYGARHLSEEVEAQYLGARSRTSASILTPRQHALLQAFAHGPELSYAEHARRFNISEHTYGNHVRQIFERLQVSNMTAAIVKARQLGLISFDFPEPSDMQPGR
jgi:DNA-binding NarL/FixJ family response regulator